MTEEKIDKKSGPIMFKYEIGYDGDKGYFGTIVEKQFDNGEEISREYYGDKPSCVNAMNADVVRSNKFAHRSA